MKAPARCPWLFDRPFAHRGLWAEGGPPENSMAAFHAAWGAHLGVELDVRASLEHEPIVIHDATLARTAHGEGLVSAQSAGDLAKITLKGGGALPHLADVLSAFPNMAMLVELKVGSGQEGPLEEKVAALLKGRLGPTAVMSFNPRALAAFAAFAPAIARGQLTSGFSLDRGAGAALLDPDDDAGAAISAPDFLSCNVDALEGFGAPAARRLNLPLITWTVRTPAQLASARALAGNWIFETLPVESVALGG